MEGERLMGMRMLFDVEATKPATKGSGKIDSRAWVGNELGLFQKELGGQYSWRTVEWGKVVGEECLAGGREQITQDLGGEKEFVLYPMGNGK